MDKNYPELFKLECDLEHGAMDAIWRKGCIGACAVMCGLVVWPVFSLQEKRGSWSVGMYLNLCGLYYL